MRSLLSKVLSLRAIREMFGKVKRLTPFGTEAAGKVIRLTLFELQKVWFRRGFQLAACALLLIDLFFLWYAYPGDNGKPKLGAYRAFLADTAGMTEEEKTSFTENLKQTIDGVSFVEQVLAMQNSEIGVVFAEQELAANPGLFETYLESYRSGDYLRYTDSLEQESAFLSEIYAEEQEVANYGSYLDSIQNKKDSLNGISIFAARKTGGFASENIRKSAEDFRALSSEGIRWAPSKTVTSAMTNQGTDVLLVLFSFLLVGGLIFEEKQKGLFFVTRCTRYGRGCCILSKLSALFLNCFAGTALLYGVNLLYFGLAAGFPDMTARLQSLAPYRGSSLSISILGFIALSVLTKALVLFAAGAALTAICILSENGTLPYFCGLLLWTASWCLYRFIPAASKAGVLKYVNLFGVLRAEDVYGAYLNLNLFGHPVSRIPLSWLFLCVVLCAGAGCSLLFFIKCERFGYRKALRPVLFRFRPHASAFRHEAYKLLVTNHGLLVLTVFCFLIGCSVFQRVYTPTTQEKYYLDIMLRLEGELTEEKAALIRAESARFQEAFAEIEKIDSSVASGEIDGETGEAMKLKWYGVTAFYPQFRRVEQQLASAQENGSKFLYDTGYLYLFGISGDGALSDFLLLTTGILLAFSQAISMEYQSGAWAVLGATALGKRGVLARKAAVCALAASVFSVIPFVFRWIRIAQVFPTHGLFFSVQNLPCYQGFPAFLPVIALIGLKMLLQAAVGVTLALITAGLSGWRKNHAQTVFFGLLVLCAPVVLAALGLERALVFSLYPIYTCTFLPPS